MPTLAQLSSSNRSAVVVALPDPVTGDPVSTLYLNGGNPQLRPELGRSFTTTLDWSLPVIFETLVSLSYIHVSLTNGIAAPTVNGSGISSGGKSDSLRHFLNTSPTSDQIDAAYNQYRVNDSQGPGRDSVTAIFYGGLQNIGTVRESSWEWEIRSKWPAPIGRISMEFRGDYVAAFDREAFPGAPFEPLVGTVFNPPRLRLEAIATWSYQQWILFTNAEFTGRYADTLLTEKPSVASQTTLNATVSYEFDRQPAPSPLNGATMELTVRNLTNSAPPPAPGPNSLPGFDLANANAHARTIALEFRKQW